MDHYTRQQSLEIKLQERGSDSFCDFATTWLSNTDQGSIEVVGILLNNVPLREGVLHYDGGEIQEKDSPECGKQCQAFNLNNEA